MKKILLLALLQVTFLFTIEAQEISPKRLYLANDTHVDLMYNGTEEQWDAKILDMADFYLTLGEQTKNEPDPAKRSKWNYDCAYWLYTLEKKKSPEYVARIIDQLKRQQASIPYNFTLPIYGAFSPESILRSFYYGGYLERKYGIDVDIAVCQENATIPLGLSSLWAGSGASYSWKGICYCATKTKNHGPRDHEMYYYKGLDDQKVLMKWYSMFGNNTELGGYSEILEPTVAVWQMDTLTNTKRYPYKIAGAFGKGWDNMVNYSFDMVWHLNHRTKPGTKLFLSNELDFFRDFEKTYGDKLPSETKAFGNEWDILPASLSNVSSGIRRSMEKLRTAEALASIGVLNNTLNLSPLKEQKDAFMYGLSTISAHGWTIDGPVTKPQFATWARKQFNNIDTYVENLQKVSADNFAQSIPKSDKGSRFAIFNSLSWSRDASVFIPYAKNVELELTDNRTNQKLAFQKVSNGLMVQVQKVPSVGYSTIEVKEVNKSQKTKSKFSFNNNVLETPFYIVQFAKNGVITSLVEKATKKQWVKTGQFINDLGAGPAEGTCKLIENGHIIAKIEASGLSPLKYKTVVTFNAFSNEIKFDNTVLQNFGDPIYWTYGLNVENPSVKHEEIGAMIEAKTVANGGQYANKMARLDHLSANHFVTVGDAKNSAVLSNLDALFFKIADSKPQDLDQKSAQIRFLVGGQIDKDLNLGIPNQAGDSLFTNHFAFKPYRGETNNLTAMKASLEDQNPLLAIAAEGASSLTQVPAKSYLEIDNPTTVAWVLKPGESGGIALRTWNMAETAQNVSIKWTNTINKAQLATHVETVISPLNVQANTLILNPKRQQMQTVIIE